MSHCSDDALDVLGGGLVAHDVVARFGGGLVAGHGRVLVFEYDVEDVLGLLDAVGDGCHASPEECRVAHQRVLLVGYERVHAAPGSAAQRHGG